MTAILDTIRVIFGDHLVAIHGGNGTALRAYIGRLMDAGADEYPSGPTGGTPGSRNAHVLLIASTDGADETVIGTDLDLSGILAPDGWLALCGDALPLRRKTSISYVRQQHPRVLSFGRSADCDIAATEVAFSGGCLRFRIGQQWFQVPAWCRSSLKEVLAAVAVARIFGVPLDQAARRLACSQPVGYPRQVVQAGDVTIIHDSTAVTPATLGRALDLLREFPASGRRIVCCGELAADGQESTYRTFAEEIVSRCGADVLVACGATASGVVEAARAAGLSAAVPCSRVDEASQRLGRTLKSGDVLLVVGDPSEIISQLVQNVRNSLCVVHTSSSAGPVGGFAAAPAPLTSFIS